MARIRVGTSGWHYDHWRGTVYPEDLPTTEWLTYLSANLETCEINNTFYRNPKPGAWEAWRDTVPAGFRFAVKGSKWVTWNKLLIDVEGSLDRFLEGARILGDKLGPVLYQLPPWFGRKPDTAARVEAFLRIIPEDTEAVFEFLNATWWVDETFELLNHHHVGFSFSDRHDKKFPLQVTGPFAYLRLHGPGPELESNYSDEQLEEWADTIRGLERRVNEIYVYFDNDHDGFAFHNAVALRAMLEG